MVIVNGNVTTANLVTYSNDINEDLNFLINANNISLANNPKVELSGLALSQTPILIAPGPSNLAPSAIISALSTLVRLTKRATADNKSYAGMISSAQKKPRVTYAPFSSYDTTPSRFAITSLTSRVRAIGECICDIIESWKSDIAFFDNLSFRN